MSLRCCCTQHNLHIRFQWMILILLSSTAEYAARELQLRKHTNLRQTSNIIATTVGNDMTSRHCAVRCSRNIACDAYNYGMTSHGKWICEEIKDGGSFPGSIENEVGWSYYMYKGYTIYLQQSFIHYVIHVRVYKSTSISYRLYHHAFFPRH